MEVEFMTADTTLPPCMPLPRAMLRLPISSTAKVMYARMLDIVFLSGIEDTNGILFIHFPIVELAAALARSTMTVKRKWPCLGRERAYPLLPAALSGSRYRQLHLPIAAAVPAGSHPPGVLPRL